MNIFSCPFDSKDESKYPYKIKEQLFALQRVAFAIEQAITTFFEITKNNEIIYEVDFENDRVQEVHTKYDGEPESWGWQENVKEQLSKVKPISTTQIRDEQDVYSILTNKEKLEDLLKEYEKKYNHQLEEQEICCDEITPCVTNDNNNSNKKTIIDAINCNNANVSHKGENGHSKKIEELNNEHLKLELKAKMKEEIRKHKKEQQITEYY
jgi:hypothetical protein